MEIEAEDYTVAVMGAGTMGRGIAQVADGYDLWIRVLRARRRRRAAIVRGQGETNGRAGGDRGGRR